MTNCRRPSALTALSLLLMPILFANCPLPPARHPSALIILALILIPILSAYCPLPPAFYQFLPPIQLDHSATIVFSFLRWSHLDNSMWALRSPQRTLHQRYSPPLFLQRFWNRNRFC